jgi:hypothetical protein
MNRPAVRMLCLLLISFSGDVMTVEADEDMLELPDDRPVWHAVSENHLYHVTVGPVSDVLSIGQFQQWVVEIFYADQSPVYPAEIQIGGGMLGHQHGLPTQPKATAYLGAGQYLVEGMKLNMEGEWTLMFFVQSDKGSDTASVVILAEY